MLLIQFLEFCIGSLDLWPSYIYDLLFLKDASPRHISKVAAFFYGHDVPLKVACRPTICVTHTVRSIMSFHL